MTYRKTTLENGIRVVTETMSCTRSVAIGVLVDAGPRQDPDGLDGLSHMVEHLMFQGTSNRDSMQIANLMDMGGGHVGAFTTRDYTCYFATVLDDYYTYTLDLFGDILLNSIFPEDDLKREKTAVLREIDAGDDSPDGRVHALVKETAWPNHPLGKPMTGRPDGVQAMTREDVIYFVHEQYTPDRLIVAAAGNVNHDDFVAQVRDSLWRMLGERVERKQEKPEWKTAVSLKTMPVSQAYFSIALPAYEYTHADRYSLHVLNNLLGGGISSRLFRRLREERGLVYNIGSEYHAYKDGGMMVIEGATTPDYLMTVLDMTMVELRILFSGHDPVDPEELWKSKMQIRGQHLIASEDVNTCMSRLATQELYFGHHISAAEIVSQIEGVDMVALEATSEIMLANLSMATVAVVASDAPHLYSEDSIAGLLNESIEKVQLLGFDTVLQ